MLCAPWVMADASCVCDGTRGPPLERLARWCEWPRAMLVDNDGMSKPHLMSSLLPIFVPLCRRPDLISAVLTQSRTHCNPVTSDYTSCPRRLLSALLFCRELVPLLANVQRAAVREELPCLDGR